MSKDFVVRVLPGEYAICRLAPESSIPDSPEDAKFCSVTVTEAEISVVCESSHVPAGCQTTDADWGIVYIDAQMDLDIVGVLAKLLAPLRKAGISIFAISTFDTDYVLIRKSKLPVALNVLRSVGYDVRDEDG